ncbi:NUDIX domain-containing protein [Rhodoligotrophos ferricapiens]|uniref:NUDIX domain-containing protein n=1 Tax=Rhodoligotrophos ferricapiens TaxID=3069264 RepID=UPI00315CB5AD
MAKVSAGILMYQGLREDLAVLLVHPGGPFWRKRDLGTWSIPKGEIDPGEDPEAAARREFAEELGFAPTAILRPLGSLRQRGGKQVEAFACEEHFDVRGFHCKSMVEIEWPPRTGRMQSFPEIDAAEWFPLGVAQEKILPSQRPFLDRLTALVGSEGSV